MTALSVWVIYRNPSDFPGKMAVRRRYVSADGDIPDPAASFTCDVEPDGLTVARPAVRDLAPGAVCLSRSPGDDPVIVETWI